jgi:hypothetical protein
MTSVTVRVYGAIPDYSLRAESENTRKRRTTTDVMRPRGLALIVVCAALPLCQATGFFTSITPRLSHNPSMRAYGISVVDADGDHNFEAFVCGYGFSNILYKWHNSSQSLVDSTPEKLRAPTRSAIGVASCDVDGDGQEEIYVLNTDSYSGDKQFGDSIFHKQAGVQSWSDMFEDSANAQVRNSFAGRSVACVDRTGNGTYAVAAASYGRQLHLYESGGGSRIVDQGGPNKVGFEGVTGGRGLTGGPLNPGKDYTDTPGMDVFMNNERGCNFLFRNQGDGTFTEVRARCFAMRGAITLSVLRQCPRGVSIIGGQRSRHRRLLSKRARRGAARRQRGRAH